LQTESKLVDSFGRQITYLRLSLTDLCNFRCVYCMPPEGLPNPLPKDDYLTVDETLRFVRVIGKCGVHRIRLTGGEPLLRRDLTDIIRALKAVETVHEISITTNGAQLKPKLDDLKRAGLDRINISLDSVDPKRFEEITLRDCYYQVLESALLALEAGFPVKLNMVVLAGLTAREILNFVQLAVEYPFEVRFLEFMPLCGTGWKPEMVMPIQQVRAVVQEHFNLDLLPRLDEVAQSYQIRGGKGKVGFIASLTESFCDKCSRIRLTADGKIKPCLFSDKEVSIKQLLKEKAPDEEILDAIQLAARIKPKGNWFQENPFDNNMKQEEHFDSNPLIHNVGG